MNKEETLFPIVMKVAAKTIAQDLYRIDDELKEIKNRIKSENRQSKIKSVLENTDYKEKKLEEDKEYKELMKKGGITMSKPNSKIHYIDFKYDENK